MLRLHEIIDEMADGHVYLVTEFCANGSLGDMVRQHNASGENKGLPSWQVRWYFLDMLKALHYLHTIVGVVHCNIKPENMVIGTRREAALIDFGVSAT